MEKTIGRLKLFGIGNPWWKKILRSQNTAYNGDTAKV